MYQLHPKVIRRMELALEAVLPKVINVKLQSSRRTALPIWEIAGQKIKVGWASEGWLRQVKDVLERDISAPGIIIARRMSPGARELLSQAGIGWVDETGGAEIAIGSIIVSRSGNRSDEVERSPRWTRSVVAVAEAILARNISTVAEIKEEIGLSTGSCTNALKTLTDMGYLEAKAERGPNSKRKIVDPHILLDDYAEAASNLENNESLIVGVVWRDPIEGLTAIGKKWDRAGIKWGVTGTVASMLLAPTLTTAGKAEVYVEADSIAMLRSVAERADLQSIEGGRLTLRPFPTRTTRQLLHEVDRLKIVPWPRVFADLRNSGVRGEEAAEHLREVMLG